MPIFEYRCKTCEYVFEELAKFTDKIKCPRCGGASKKLVATQYRPAFIHRQGKFHIRRKLSTTGAKK